MVILVLSLFFYVGNHDAQPMVVFVYPRPIPVRVYIHDSIEYQYACPVIPSLARDNGKSRSETGKSESANGVIGNASTSLA